MSFETYTGTVMVPHYVARVSLVSRPGPGEKVVTGWSCSHLHTSAADADRCAAEYVASVS